MKKLFILKSGIIIVIFLLAMIFNFVITPAKQTDANIFTSFSPFAMFGDDSIRLVVDEWDVSIGTTTPSGAKLSIWGDGTNPIFQVIDNASSTKMIILNSGNVGIGTTSPFRLLDVDGNMYADNYYGIWQGNVITDAFISSASIWNDKWDLASSTIDNSSLTNSTISGISLGGTLNALTATDSTLTFSGSYDGSVARTIGLNLSNANTWAGLQTFNAGFISASSTLTGDFKVVGNATTTGIFNANKLTGDGQEITLSAVTGSTFSTIQDMQNIFHSAGWVSGGEITDDTDGTITVAFGTGLIRAIDSDTSTILFFDWAAESGANVSLVDNDINYIYAEYNSGSPQVIATTTNIIDNNTNVLLATISRKSTTLHINSSDKTSVGNHALNMIFRLKETLPYGYVSGAIVSEVGTRNISITTGSFWRGLTPFTTSALDTSAAGTFTYYFRDGGTGFNSQINSKVIDNIGYDNNSGATTTLSNNKFGVHWIYNEADDDDVSVLYGQGNYTLSEAQDATPPAAVPLHLQVEGIIISKIIIKKSDSTFTQIESLVATKVSGSIATEHPNLGILAWTSAGHTGTASTFAGFDGAGAATEYTEANYLLINGTRNPTGNFNWGGYNILNIGQASTTQITPGIIFDDNGSEGGAGEVLSSLGPGLGTDWIAAGAGTVTSVGVAVPIGLSVSGTNPITGAGTFTFAYDFEPTFIPYGGASREMATSTAFTFISGSGTLNTTILTASGNVAGATYGSDSSVSNAELLFINTLSSNAQTQMDSNVDQNLWLTINGDTGSTAANITTDTLTIAGGTNITSVMSGDTLTINLDDVITLTDATFTNATTTTFALLGEATPAGAFAAFDPLGRLISTTTPSGGGGTPGGSNTQIQFNDSGAFGGDAVFVWDDGNKRLGIGTTTPSEPLHVAGNILSDGVIKIQYGSAAAPGLAFALDPDTGMYGTANQIWFSLGGSQKIIFGSAGITMQTGTGISSISTGKYNLSDTSGESTPTYIFTGDNDTGIWRPTIDQLALGAGAVEFITLIETTQDILVFNEDGDDIDFRVETSGNANAFFVQGNDGKVGIGTSTPAFTLDVFGTLRVDGNLTLGGTLALGTNNLTMTGSLAATGARVLKGWFADVESTNMYTVGGTSLSSTFSPIAGSASILTVGTLASGSITSNFGNIDIGGSNLDADGTVNLGGVVTISPTGTLIIPQSATCDANADGELCHDTTDNQLILDSLVIQTKVRIWGTTIASTSPAFISGGLLPIPTNLDGYTMTEIRCKVDGGTSKIIAVEDASANSTEDITCAATVTSDDGSITNATVTAAEEIYIDFGASSGVVNYVTISVFGFWARE